MANTKVTYIALLVFIAFTIAPICTINGAAHGAQGDGSENTAEVTVIPLNRIWSNGMQGTRDVATLGKEAPELSDKIVQMLIDASEKVLRSGTPFLPGFIVEGEGQTALQETEASLRNGRQMPDIEQEKDVTLVFFACRLGQDVQLVGAEERGTAIAIKYCFVSHSERNTSIRFALIPLGKLPAGKYSVLLQQTTASKRVGEIITPKKPPSTVSGGDRYVAQPFSFEVRKKGISKDKGMIQ